MAKITNSVAFKNALIDLSTNTIVEVTKDSEFTYSLSDVLNRFEGKYVAITIKEDAELGIDVDSE
ncbi:YonK family protein [Staphylococcus saprophyticus]|uniref:YonK family protein n=1 Tax=Staphylococcus saprophyticus TaxID=29385 RepID=UPI0024C3C30E|nr:YonK family protein [Staphylococcus saprophyticus]MDK1672899.1 YonK family protein [Staphylococcus saprophyticus]